MRFSCPQKLRAHDDSVRVFMLNSIFRLRRKTYENMRWAFKRAFIIVEVKKLSCQFPV
jgi:hypothetical protein